MCRILIALFLLIPQDTLTVKVSLVSVGVRVTDSKGRNVTGLKADDFSVSDDGVPQKIEFFSSEEQPVTMGILLDHSFSMATNAKLDRAKEAAQSLVRATRNGSEYFYVQFDENVKLASDFTTEPQAVLSAIEQTPLGGGTALYDAVIEGVNLTRKAQLPRQVLVIISDGADQHSKHRLDEAIQLVRESEIQVYTIGYFDPVEEKLYRSGSDQALTLIDGRRIDNPRIVLQKLAQESGGLAFFPRTDAELAKAVDEITNDVRNQYTLAFYPNSETDRYHQLRVAVRGGKYIVRGRPGYGTAEMAAVPAHRDIAPAYESHIERRNGRVFFRDDFSDHNSGWPNQQSARYVPGGYQLAGSNVFAVNGPAFTDFRASVSVKVEPEFRPTRPLQEGQAFLLTGAGLMFRDGDQGYYILAVFPGMSFQEGFIAAFQSTPGKTRELDRWPLARTAGQDVKIEVRCQHSECAVYQDKLFRGQLKKLTLTEGHLGLYLIGKGEATFRDFSAEEIN